MEKVFDRLAAAFLLVLLGFSIHGVYGGLQNRDKLSQKPTELISLDDTPGPAIYNGIQCPLCKMTAKLVEINQDTHSYAYHVNGDIYDCGTHETECKHGTSEVVSSVKKTIWQRLFD